MRHMRIYAGAVMFGLLLVAVPAFAQDYYKPYPSGDQTYQQPMQQQTCQSPQFFCGSLNRCANSEECNKADAQKSGTQYQNQQQQYNQQYQQQPSDMKPCAEGQQPSPSAPCLLQGGYDKMTDQSKQYMQNQYMQNKQMTGQDQYQGQNEKDTQWFGQPGMSEEEFNKQNEEREQHMNEQRFQQMKRGLSQFKNGVNGMKKNINNMKKNLGKCGVGLPAELTDAIDKSTAVIQKLDAAKTADELEDVIGDVEDVGGVMQDWGPRMGDLMRICEMMKRSDIDYKRMERDIMRVIKQADAAKKKMDLSDMTAGLKEALAKLKDAKDAAKTLAKTDTESALEKLDNEFYGEFDTLNNARQEIETVLNVTRGLRDGKNEIKKYDSQLKTLKRQKKDTSELEGDLGDIKKKIAELEAFMKQKGIKADDIIERVEELFDVREEFLDKLNELRGGSEFEPQIKTGPSFDFRLPQGFERQSNGQVMQQGGDQGTFSPNNEMMRNF